MFRIQSLVIFLWYSCCLSAQQTYWVSNRGDLVEVDFVSVQDAINAASNGDTILLYPRQVSYGVLTLDKSLHLIGAGYNMDTLQQPSLSYEFEFPSSYFTSVTIIAEGSGSSFQSIDMGRVNISDGATDLRIFSCYTNTMRIRDARNIQIKGCYMTGRTCPFTYRTSPGGRSICVGGAINFLSANASNIIIANSILVGSESRNVPIYGRVSGLVVKNCYLGFYIAYQSDVSNTMYINNISTTALGGPNSVAHNNIILSGQPTQNANGNRYGHTYTEVFGDVNDRSFDLRYELAPNSPAISTGLGGIDCGPFGGSEPYLPSGVVGRPLIYQLNMPVELESGNDMHVNVKVKTTNHGQ